MELISVDRLAISLFATANMSGSVKLFQFIQKCHQMIGIHSIEPNQNQWYTKRTAIFMSFSTQCILTSSGFLLFKAESMFEYGFTYFILITLIVETINYTLFIWQSENTIEFIDNCEKFIEKRE